MEPVEIEAKTLIQKSKTPSNDYVINPCTGCVPGCAYCFAIHGATGAQGAPSPPPSRPRAGP
ncbi:hypothetical protein PYK79_12485 [Streptomyces sp. ID05-04B]|uniref:hypothetical protein n=1 Tax=unclassified Streptomyces TaxID=2593676 RepID=UPI0020B1427C|nr:MULTISPECIES: hypothetical protein [unclassified Streptomyces]MDX5564012.1 hypothetical protein [Streptomyces sp. ID05-04B]